MKRSRSLAVALSVLVYSLPQVAAAQAADRPTLALVGGQVLDGYGGPPIRDGVVLVAGERIVAVGPKSEIAIPEGVKTISTEGMTVLPGMMDMHVHLMILGHADYRHWDLTYMPRFRDEIMPIAAKQLLMSGVTTVRDLGARLEDILPVKERIAKGRSRGRAFSPRGRSCSGRRTRSTRRSSAGGFRAPPTRAPRRSSSSTPASTSSS
jgi:imidazolonepropionase-like amidohydrolase